MLKRIYTGQGNIVQIRYIQVAMYVLYNLVRKVTYDYKYH